jgi:uncharacterized glyoxalase superfamily protein PhnB
MNDAPRPTDPTVMNGVIPYLAMAGRAAEACDFYARAFGATELGRMPFPDGKPGLIHAQVEINRGALMMTDYDAMMRCGDAEKVARVVEAFLGMKKVYLAALKAVDRP